VCSRVHLCASGVHLRRSAAVSPYHSVIFIEYMSLQVDLVTLITVLLQYIKSY
jgi:hypothetical protein